MASRRPLIAVHGFQFDPKDEAGFNDPAFFFDDMAGICGRPVDGFSWYSVPFGFEAGRPFKSLWQTVRAWTGAWAHGKLHPYRYAWDLATKAADDLVQAINAWQGPLDLVAHSLGSRVVLLALQKVPRGKVRRVVFFNGAELARNAEKLAPNTDAQVLNLVVSCDRVLAYLGAYFNGDGNAPCIGGVGLKQRPPNWRDLFLDDAAVQAKARSLRGWGLRANNPRDLLDHSESYHFAGNGDLVRAWLDGDDLADLTA